jgi:hypothetical protein
MGYVHEALAEPCGLRKGPAAAGPYNGVAGEHHYSWSNGGSTLPKSGKFAGKYASHGVPEVAQTYELEKGHVYVLTRSHGVFFNDVADGFLDKTEVTFAI